MEIINMSTRHTLAAFLTLAIGLFFTTSAHAALESRLGGQAVYDTDLNITWLADSNLAASNTFGVSGINADGSMTWDTAQTWIGAMNAANYLRVQQLETSYYADSRCKLWRLSGSW
jgi:hypothetical protein